MLIVKILIGVIIADFISGIIHWAQDNLGSPNTPIFGSVIEDGIIHHQNPEKFLDSTVWHRSRIAILGALVAFILLTLIFGLSAIIVSACIAGALMIEIQVYAHTDNPPAPIRILQKIGIIQSGLQHKEHHNGQPTSTYCVITSWLNPLLDKIKFWSLLHSGLNKY